MTRHFSGQNDMSALAYLRSQAAEARASGEKPYSLFMVSPERVLGLKRAAEVRATRGRDASPSADSPLAPSRHISRTNAFYPPPTLADRCPPPLHITAVQERRRRRRRGDVPLRQDTEDRGQDGTIEQLPPTHSATFDDETRVSLSATDWLALTTSPLTQLDPNSAP